MALQSRWTPPVEIDAINNPNITAPIINEQILGNILYLNNEVRSTTDITVVQDLSDTNNIAEYQFNYDGELVVVLLKIPVSSTTSPVTTNFNNPINTWRLRHKINNNTWQVEYTWRNVQRNISNTVTGNAIFGSIWLIDAVRSQNQRHGIPILFRNDNTGVMTVEFEITYSTAFNNWAQNRHSRDPQIQDLMGASFSGTTNWLYSGNGLNYGLEIILL